ncbi:hypothetical protein XaC1_492 [Xanthomonas phage XaC1]|nr:hypothetical protein XaC1_492 [Xanthomonas phage XaC1]
MKVLKIVYKWVTIGFLYATILALALQLLPDDFYDKHGTLFFIMCMVTIQVSIYIVGRFFVKNEKTKKVTNQ